jgi:hypothetical protein
MTATTDLGMNMTLNIGVLKDILGNIGTATINIGSMMILILDMPTVGMNVTIIPGTVQIYSMKPNT